MWCLAPSSAITGFKFKPATAKFPDGALGNQYMEALRTAGVIA
jgi:hypothetical protein